MIVSDFYMLESFYGAPHAVQFYEDIARQYGVEPVRQAIRAGDVAFKKISCGPNAGRLLLWLSEQGRSKAGHLGA